MNAGAPAFPRGRVLLLCYGNTAREDDGLGPLLAEAAAALDLPGLTVETDYQLNIEYAATVAQYDAVVFADAAADGPEPFSFAVVEPKAEGGVSTHSVSPAGIMHLARLHFRAQTAGYVLAIRGYSFAMFTETLTDRARANLDAAVAFLSTARR